MRYFHWMLHSLSAMMISFPVLCSTFDDIYVPSVLIDIIRDYTLKKVTLKLDSDTFKMFHFDTDNPYFNNNKSSITYNGLVDSLFSFKNIPEGTFDMGSPNDEEGRWKNEKTIKNIYISEFHMQTTPVTQIQYWIVTQKNPSRFQNSADCPDEHVLITDKISMCPNHPVENVSWKEAKKYINILNKRSLKYIYRLPTEAEWEYAARAGHQSRYSFGSNIEDLNAHGWSRENSSDQTHTVASLISNEFGLSDMHGNVWEWVLDNYSRKGNRYEGFFSFLRGSLKNPVYKKIGPNRVVRGGGWFSSSRYLRSAIRVSRRPGYRCASLGFRLVRTAS